MSWLERHAKANVCYLTTVGRKTGKPHEIEIWFAVADGRIFFLAGGRDRSDWIRNIRNDGRVSIRIGDDRIDGQGRLIEDEGSRDDALARRLLDGKYHGWREGRRLTQWAQTALPAVVEPAG